MHASTLRHRRRVELLRPDSAEAIAQEVRNSGRSWVWIEGFSRAGKSVFATRLANALQWTNVIYLDHMALPMDQQPDSTQYADHLDRDRIRAAIETNEPVIVEGVCLQDVVDGMRLDPPLRIYLARVSSPTTEALIWHDGIELQEPERQANEVNWLVLDTLTYHRRVKPHAHADRILVRVETDQSERAVVQQTPAE